MMNLNEDQKTKSAYMPPPKKPTNFHRFDSANLQHTSHHGDPISKTTDVNMQERFRAWIGSGSDKNDTNAKSCDAKLSGSLYLIQRQTLTSCQDTHLETEK